jgi:sirohydrochlorin cobaltochelatase
VILEAFERRLKSGDLVIGQVAISRLGDSVYELQHRSDAAETEFGLVQTTPEGARRIARADSSGAYRPLKGAPNLVRGWKLRLASSADALRALDYLYPGAFATWVKREDVCPVPLRETLARQTGMYRVTQKASYEQANKLIGRFCASCTGCVRTVLWEIVPGRPITSLSPAKCDPAVDQAGDRTDVIPFLCVEACNLLVAELRKIVKSAN